MAEPAQSPKQEQQQLLIIDPKDKKPRTVIRARLLISPAFEWNASEDSVTLLAHDEDNPLAWCSVTVNLAQLLELVKKVGAVRQFGAMVAPPAKPG